MASNAPDAVIIKKVKKVQGHGHHGGAWKVAYADFVTAMMAFFLLLWLLNATTEQQKQGIADYFSPVSVSKSSGGSGGLLGGRAISSPGAMTSRTSIPSLSVKIDAAQGATMGDADQEGGADKGEFTAELSKTDSREKPDKPDKGMAEKAMAEAAVALKQREQQIRQIENARFDGVEQRIRRSVQQTPEIKALERHLLFDRTADGLRIQVVDRAGKPMFPSGAAKMFPRTKTLLEKIADAIKAIPNKIRLSGHTDSVPFKRKNGYDNWNLSADRAQESRRVLVAAGLPADRIVSVAGRADSDPLLPDDTRSPRNRRISIVLLRTKPITIETPPPTPGRASGGAKAPARPASPPEIEKDWTGPRIR